MRQIRGGMRGGAGGTNNAYRMLGRNKRALGFALYNCRQEVGLSVVCMCAHVCIRCVGAPAAVNARSVPAARVRKGTGQLISKLSTVSYWQPTENDSTNTNPQQEASYMCIRTTYRKTTVQPSQAY